MKPIRLFLIDDHFFVRKGLSASLASEPDIDVVAQAEDMPSAIREFRKHRPAVTLLDQHLATSTGLEILKELLSEFPDARIVFLTVDESEETVFQAMDNGAVGYLSKSSPRRILLEAIREVAAGNLYLPAAFRQLLDRRKERPTLTQREAEVLSLIVAGESNKMIAHSLGIAEMTVKVHIARIFEKLGVHDRISAAMIAVQRGLAKVP